LLLPQVAAEVAVAATKEATTDLVKAQPHIIHLQWAVLVKAKQVTAAALVAVAADIRWAAPVA
jgi:hypothetical protein